jgi:hypothetical protein
LFSHPLLNTLLSQAVVEAAEAERVEAVQVVLERQLGLQSLLAHQLL